MHLKRIYSNFGWIPCTRGARRIRKYFVSASIYCGRFTDLSS